MTDDTNKVFGQKMVSDKLSPDPELVKTLQDSYAVSLKIIEARVKTLVGTLVPLVEKLKDTREKGR